MGTAAHEGIQVGTEEMIKNYFSNYYIISDLHINEEIKLRYIVPRISKLLPQGEAEVKLECDEFIGYIDWLVPVGDDEYDIYDFKYSNNQEGYLKSPQIHLYKYYFEKLNPTKHIRKLHYVFLPKVMIRQKKTEDLFQFRKRLQETLEALDISKESCIKEVTYDEHKILEFFKERDVCVSATSFPKNKTRLCDWCPYKELCHNNNPLNIVETINKKGKR